MPEVQAEAPAAAAPPIDTAPPGLDDAAILAQLQGAPASAPPPTPDAGKPPPVEEVAKTPQESALLRSLQKRERDMLARAQHLGSLEQSIPQRIEEGIRQGIDRALKERFADPRALVKHAAELGVEHNAIAEALLNKDAPSPEEMARRALAEAQELKKQIGDRERLALSRDNEQSYMRLYESMTDKLEHLSLEYEREEILPATYRLIAEYRDDCARRGVGMRPVSDAQWLRLLDMRAKAKHDRYLERQKAKGAVAPEKAASQEATKAVGNGSGHQGERPGASATTTLGKGLGERQSVATPDPALMTDDEVLARVRAATTR